jgi:type VI secretion system protein ImpA
VQPESVGGAFLTDMDYSGISQTFEGGNPAGDDLRGSGELIAVFRAIKDERSAARSDDRSRDNIYVTDGEENAGAVLQPSERWRSVHDACVAELSSRTKDIELLSWLAESTVRVHGIVGLAGVFDAMRQLITGGVDTLFPLTGEDSPADRFSSLAGLNGSQDSDGTLIRPLHLTSLIPDQVYGRFSLWEFDQAARKKNSGVMAAFQEAATAADGAAFLRMRGAAGKCAADVAAIDSFLTEVFKADAPSFRRLREVLASIVLAYGELSVFVRLPKEEMVTVPEPETHASPASAAAPKMNGAAGQINDREQAFQAILQIAAFFRRTEPHSSLPFALETIVRRGRMDFMGLLAELVPDENQRREMLTRAGIEPSSPKGIQS